MDDRLRETLSAMMDDEADELSVRRLLSHDSQDDVRAQWQRWQDVRISCMMATPRPMEWTSVLLSVNCLMAAVPRQPGQSRLSGTAERVDGTGRRRLWLRWLCWSGLALVQVGTRPVPVRFSP